VARRYLVCRTKDGERRLGAGKEGRRPEGLGRRAQQDLSLVPKGWKSSGKSAPFPNSNLREGRGVKKTNGKNNRSRRGVYLTRNKKKQGREDNPTGQKQEGKVGPCDEKNQQKTGAKAMELEEGKFPKIVGGDRDGWRKPAHDTQIQLRNPKETGSEQGRVGPCIKDRGTLDALRRPGGPDKTGRPLAK